MEYGVALEKAWKDIAALTADKRVSVKFLADEYDIGLADKKILSLSCNTPAKDYLAIILLHYLIRRFQLGNLPKPTGKWVDFRKLDGGEAYYPTYKKRTIGVILRKYGSNPDAILEAAGRFNWSKAQKIFCTEDIVVLTEILTHSL